MHQDPLYNTVTCMGHDDNKCTDLASRRVICLQNIRGTCFLSIVKKHISRLKFLNQFQRTETNCSKGVSCHFYYPVGFVKVGRTVLFALGQIANCCLNSEI